MLYQAELRPDPGGVGEYNNPNPVARGTGTPEDRGPGSIQPAAQPAAELEELFFPQTGWFLDAIHERIMPLKGYTPETNMTLGELRRRNTSGL